jgi:hypothetical protein
MNRFALVLLGVLSLMIADAAEGKDSKVYEMRIYHAAPGKLEDLHNRFRNHTLKLFQKHKIESVGYWEPIDNKENKMAFLLAYPSREAREAYWKAFTSDPDWQKAAKDSEKNGKLVERVEQWFMQKTDFSADPKPEVAAGGRVFEFRNYTTPAGGLDAINARFRDHTVKLFEKHGMKNVVYFNRMKDQKDADVTLFYILSHKSADAAKASFDAFRKDPDWIAAKAASEEKAGGSLTVKDGVKSELWKGMEYSPMR